MKATTYASFSALLLAAGLAACSTDQQPAATASVPAATPVAAASAQPQPDAAAPAAVVPGRPTVPTSMPAARPAAPAPPAAAATRMRREMAGPAPAAGRLAVAPPARRWVSRPQPTTTPAAPAASATAAPDSAPTATLALDPTAAPVSNLADYLSQAAPAAQVFELRARRDTVLLGRGGTRLVVPPDAFELPANSGPVRLELREFYSTADIVLAGLGTRAGLDLLETGGMVHLYAAANGQTVYLRPGKQVLVQLPTAQVLPGMRLYEGVSSDPSHAPDWQLPGTGHLGAGSPAPASSPLTDRAALGEWVKLHPPKNPRWPSFAKNDKALLQDFSRLMPNTKADQAYLRRKRIIGKDEQLLLKELSRENHTAIRHAILLDVVVDSVGTLQTLALAAGDSALGARAQAAVRQLPVQRPASFVSTLPHGRRTVSTARGVFSVLYARSGKQLIGFQWLVMDKQLQEELAKEGQRSRAEFARQFGRTSTPLTLNAGLYYELAAGGLGWINCDRLLEPGPRILFTVGTPDPATVVSLVFKGQRSILASSRTEGGAAIFEQVPAGAAATVVALRRQNGITYLATTGISLSEAAKPPLEFHPVSLEQLRTELAAL